MLKSRPVRPLAELTLVEHADSIGAAYCARLLGDAGINVIKVEPPQGDPSRHRGPYPDGMPHPEKSGLFHYLNAGKQSVTLDLEQAADVDKLMNVVRSADVLVESNPPSTARKLGLDWGTVQKLNPCTVVTSVTPFGQDGPYRDYAADDLVIACMGGLAYATPGFPDETVGGMEEPPLRPATPVAELASGVAAATATLMALMARGRTGRGRHVDVSQLATMAALMAWDVGTASYLGVAKGRPPELGSGPMPNVYLPCKDGYVAMVAFTDTHWRRLVKLMGDPDWAQSELFATSESRAEYMDAILPGLAGWALDHTRDEIFAQMPPQGVPCFPAFEIGDTVESDQVRERRSVLEVDLGCGSRAGVPRSPLRFSGASDAGPRRAPKLGEHTRSVLSRLSRGEPIDERPTRATDDDSTGGADKSRLPLDGVRVIDLGHSAAVPFGTQWLAYMGAEVIRVESRGHGVSMRHWPPYADGVPGENRSGLFNLFTNNNLSCTLNLVREPAQKLVKDLVGISDVVVENLSTGTVERMGLGYDDLAQVRPDLIMVSLSAFGRTGPMKSFVGFHSAVAMYSGLAAVTGYPGGHPRIVGSVLPDVLSGAYVALAVVQSLYDRAATGRGDHVEIAMAEAVMSVIPEAIIDYTLNGRQSERIGNGDPKKAPHGVYPCAGDDAWIAISVGTDVEWGGLCRVAGPAVEWTHDERFANESVRLEHAEKLDCMLAGWTCQHQSYALMHALQEAGVPAGPVLSTKGLLEDPHLKARGHVVTTDHPEVGARQMLGLPWEIGGLPPVEYRPSPLLGEHVDRVLGQMLGLSKEKIKGLVQEDIVV